MLIILLFFFLLATQHAPFYRLFFVLHIYYDIIINFYVFIITTICVEIGIKKVVNILIMC